MLKKVVRRIILLILMIAAVTGGAVVVNGYEIYKDAVGKVPVSDKIAQIQEKEHYTKFDQLPQRYKVRSDQQHILGRLPERQERI